MFNLESDGVHFPYLVPSICIIHAYIAIYIIYTKSECSCMLSNIEQYCLKCSIKQYQYSQKQRKSVSTHMAYTLKKPWAIRQEPTTIVCVNTQTHHLLRVFYFKSGIIQDAQQSLNKSSLMQFNQLHHNTLINLPGYPISLNYASTATTHYTFKTGSTQVNEVLFPYQNGHPIIMQIGYNINSFSSSREKEEGNDTWKKNTGNKNNKRTFK